MYGLTAEDLRIRDTAREFVETLIPYEVDAEMAGGQLPKELTAAHHARAIELGLYATNMPTSVGGPGFTALQQVLVQEQVGKVTNAIAWVMHTPPQWWAEVATEYQKQRWLLPAVRGEKHEAYAITEEFAGSDVSALETTARREGDEYVINGIKWHVTSFNLAEYVFVQAVLVGGPHEGDHVLLVVDLPWPGVEVVRTPHYSHHIPDEHPIVSFTDVRVPVSHLVGAEGEAMTFTQDWFRFERLMVASRCVGAAQRLVDEMTTFATDRMVDGKPLGDYQLVAGMLADSATELFAARSMLYEVARGIDAGLDRKALHGQASMAKLYCSEMAGRVADRAVQIFGGRGYMRENVAERMFRELRVERIWEGASEIQRIIIGRQLMQRGPAALLNAR
ncbi:acyl-CoA dehydrogenase family protein [Mycolicibacterium aichiense]|uniref:Medium-chain specific acyl-CoA dehydrogenase, mitochondrial n=1 Tax=Mycolicibacterium aichiense TaxID=1799 RepID=A0AAD1ME71_9MYCO|nr:acyl-CoA dehydrogenase family protein [Mycolicibacterium aichiense]MCV7016576.1 acyl-CoA dehydrogenase family protein [Mycolicibacterium aichiense]BBX09646.1 butyryl-CoA dehydrogenase [Mycolicibacterium aichiense]SUA14210.1 acyl-CoA dehydrogenase [Mycolicibacterium aichiense]